MDTVLHVLIALAPACVISGDDGPAANAERAAPAEVRPPAPAVAANGPRGRLVVVGGGPAIDEIHRKTLELAGGVTAKIVIVPFASPDPGAGERSASIWQALGAMNVAVLDLSDTDAAIALLRSADLIWFRGGEQQRLMEALEGAHGVVEAIRQRYFEGATIGGTSAGAAVMSQCMIAGPAGRRGTPEARLARFGNGLGLWPDVIVDQHFVRRHRHARLENAVCIRPDLLGIGIDEATAVIVNGREFEVMGIGPVLVYDARRHTPANMAVGLVAGSAVAANPGIGLSTLRAGMRYHLDHGLVADAKPAD